MTSKIVDVPRLGEARFPSPWSSFVKDNQYIPLHITQEPGTERPGNILFEKAGPRERLFFDAEETQAAIVTCGGLCPGLNNVIRSLVLTLQGHYRVKRVLGIRYGYHGMNAANGFPPVRLDVESVSDIHESGGTLLGTSRGPEKPDVMLGYLRQLGVNVLFTIGGDGTQRGAFQLHEGAQRLGYPLAVIGIPKTIDNDIQYVSRTFGFGTAVDAARGVIDVAHTEARAVMNGVGLVKLMGRDSGFIAAGATLASGEVNYCLIPEHKFTLEGDGGLLTVLERRLMRKQHAVIVVAEGAGQGYCAGGDGEVDASGNVKYGDIGLFLRERIIEWFRSKGKPVNVRYIDPSYSIRGLAANTEDAVLCDMLARDAVHAAMSGRSGLIIGNIHNRMVHVPMLMATEGRKKVDLDSELWRAVQAVTQQPATWA
jgi:6-phosphofructokinase 1